MKKNKKNSFGKFVLKMIIYIVVLVAIFGLTVWGTKYYFYDSDYSVKSTDLSIVSVDGIKIGMDLSQIDITKYSVADENIGDCNFNFEGLSFKTNEKGVVEYIIADYSKTDLYVGQDESAAKIDKVNGIWDILGKDYKASIYNSKVDNYWKIAKYSDTTNDIYLGLIYSRYNNELNKVILSNKRIQD